MKTETKERVAFIAASLIDLTDMTESTLKNVCNVVGINAIRVHLDMGQLYYETDFETMAEKICFYIGWDPMLVIPGRTDEELTQMGHQIADLVEDTSPVDEDAAETLFSVMIWDGIGAWLAANKE